MIVVLLGLFCLAAAVPVKEHFNYTQDGVNVAIDVEMNLDIVVNVGGENVVTNPTPTPTFSTEPPIWNSTTGNWTTTTGNWTTTTGNWTTTTGNWTTPPGNLTSTTGNWNITTVPTTGTENATTTITFSTTHAPSSSKKPEDEDSLIKRIAGLF